VSKAANPVPICAEAIDVRRWLGYWLDEIDAAESSRLEAHMFECAACAHALERLVALGSSIRELHKRGQLATIVPAAFVDTLKNAGLSVREYRLRPEDSVLCTVTPRDDFVVGHLEAPLEGVTRLDAIIEQLEDGSVVRLEDIPFNRREREIVLVPSIHELRPVETLTMRVQVVALDDGGERVLGTYTFNHRATRD